MVALWLIAAHMVGDYILQGDWMASNKTRRADALLAHCFAYTLAFVIPVSVFNDGPIPSWLLLIALWVAHLVTDCRRWASGDKWPPKPILVDQSLHAVQIALLATAMTPWGVA